MEGSDGGHAPATVTGWTFPRLGQIWRPRKWWASSPKRLKIWHTADALPLSSDWRHTQTQRKQSASVHPRAETMMLVIHLFKFVYLQDSRVQALLAGPGVAYNSVFRHRLRNETWAAFLWSSATQTYRQTNTHNEQLTANTQTSCSCFVPFLISCAPVWDTVLKRLCHCSVVPLRKGKFGDFDVLLCCLESKLLIW